MNKLKPDQNIKFEGKLFRVNGYDEYTLINIYGQPKHWTSYTIIDVDNDKNRIWLGYGFAKKYYVKQWLISESEFKKNTKSVPLNGNYTGIANITFVGDQGYSLPTSELIWFDSSSEDYDFFVIERFLKKDKTYLKPLESYYHGMKILKNFTV